MNTAMCTILVVDDQPDVADTIAAMVEFAGCAATVVRSGHLAIATLQANTFDLMILDNHMPGMTGLDVLRTMQADHANRLPRVVMCSASDDSREAALRLGVSDFVMKSDADRLMTLIEAASARA